MPSPVSVTKNGAIATVTIENPPVNALSQAVRAGLREALQETEEDESLTAVLLTCEGRTFIAGADVREFGQPPAEPHLPDVIAAIEEASKPWIALLHGTALGGGLEVALGCHYRLAAPGTKLGLPEVNLGLIPGAGGTVRLPRLIAAEEALAMITSGKPVSAEHAYEIGLIDALLVEDVEQEARLFAENAARKPRPKPLMRRPTNPPRDAAAWQAELQKIKAKARGQHSPVAAAETL
ncbi:MAG: enoyl-CoA hydratase-related protein, partial [Pseudomonadota bacterium]